MYCFCGLPKQWLGTPAMFLRSQCQDDIGCVIYVYTLLMSVLGHIDDVCRYLLNLLTLNCQLRLNTEAVYCNLVR